MKSIKICAVLAAFLLALLGSGCEEEVAAPIITQVSPEFGPAESLVTFEGMNLANLISMEFNGTPLNFNTAYNSDNALLFRIPTSLETGDYVVRFTTAGGSVETDFRVTLEAPEIFSFDRESASVGEELTIYGKNFFEPLEVYFFDSIPATIVTASEDSIVAIVPEASTQGPVTVVANGGVALSPVRFFQTNEILVNDFDGNGLRANTQFWAFSSTLDQNANTAIHSSNPEPISDNFLKISGRDDLNIGFIGSVTSPTFDQDVFDNFGIRTSLSNTLFRMDVNNNGFDDTRMIIVLKERNGSPNDFSREILLDDNGWQAIELPLTRFQDIDGNLIDPVKVMSVRFILFDSEDTNNQFEANIDNIRFAEIL